ncbi:MAG: transketolase C-terminal domain-containing protein, partial [Ilumatobacteraceae bacterium]
YPPAEDDDEKHLHDAPVFDPRVGPPKAVPTGYTQAFAEGIIKEAEADRRVVAITAAMPGPTGLLPFQNRFPDRFFDVGIAEQHAVTGAAGMAMGGLRPVVAIYSTFLNRAWDQIVYDVALHRLPVVFCLDRSGITGDNGPSHHGVYDLALLAKVPGMRVLAPSSAQELQVMLHDAIELADEGPVAIRYPNGTAPQVGEHEVGVGLRARQLRRGDGSVCILAVGKLVTFASQATQLLAEHGIEATLWDVRSCAPLDPAMIADAATHHAVVTCEDGVRDGGIGMTIADQVHAITADVPVEVLGLPSKFIPQGKPDRILAQLGLDADGIAAAARHSIETHVER